VVVGCLFARRWAIGSSAAGRVLDLGVAGPPLDSYRADAVDSLTVVEPDHGRAERLRRRAAGLGLSIVVVGSWDQAGADADHDGPYDSIVSVLGLASHADLPTTAARVVALLVDGGSLSFVEPTWAAGVLPAAATPFIALSPRLGSLHVNRDVPSAVRALGLTVVDIERFTMPTVIWPLRSFAHATARRTSSFGDHR
jgi:hypothetical protein